MHPPPVHSQMVRNCCGGNTTMPAIFNRTLATDSTTVWPWGTWTADALVINLGTNDGVRSRHFLGTSALAFPYRGLC